MALKIKSVKQIFLLKLEGDKWFVGSSYDVDQTVERLRNAPTKWIKKYPIIEIYEVFPITDKDPKIECDFGCLIETKYIKRGGAQDIYHTINYMLRLGRENVRGSIFGNCRLSNSQMDMIDRQAEAIKNRRNCNACDKRIKKGEDITCNHYRIDSPSESSDGWYAKDSKDSLESSFEIDAEAPRCEKCQRISHKTADCKARVTLGGKFLPKVLAA